MITLEQLDELEGRIIKALELIGDLRAENSRLEVENQKLREEHDRLKNAIDQKERDIKVLKQEFEKTSNELNQLKGKESILEKRIAEILNKLANAESGSQLSSHLKKTGSGSVDQSISTTVAEVKSLEEKQGLVGSKKIEEKIGSTPVIESKNDLPDESIVILEDADIPLKKPENLVQTKEREEVKEVSEEDEVIILDEDEDEIALLENDVEEETLRTTTTPAPSEDLQEIKKEIVKEESVNLIKDAKTADLIVEDEIILDDDLGNFEIEDDDDFLIVEEDESKK